MPYVLTPDFLHELLFKSAKKPIIMYMNILDYAQVRKFGQNYLDINTDAAYLKLGWQGTLFGALIKTVRTGPKKGTVETVDEDGKVSRFCFHCQKRIPRLFCKTSDCVVRGIYED